MSHQRQTRSIHQQNLDPILETHRETFSKHNIPFGKRSNFAFRWNLALRYLNYIQKLEKTYMPPKAFRNNGNNPMPKFASVRLNESDKAAFDEWMDKRTKDFIQLQTDMLVSGWKLSVKADLENSCFIVSYTCGAEKHINYNVCVSSRSDDWEEAIWLNLYKVLVLYQNAALPTDQPKNNWG